jgi:lipopolysaccharide transport system permease protein
MNRPLKQQIELVLSLAKRDLKSRYKDSVLGFMWSFFRPVFITVIIYTVFSKIIVVPFNHAQAPYWLHVLLSILIWNFFIGSLTDAMNSVIANGNLLKRCGSRQRFSPSRQSWLMQCIFVLALAIVFGVVLLTGNGVSWYILLFPILLGILALFILGAGVYLAALNVFYRDVANIFELLAMAWFYVTPIIYPLEVAQDRITTKLGPEWFTVYMLNPLAAIMASIRKVVLYQHGEGEIQRAQLMHYLAIAIGVSVVISITGAVVFRRLSRRFADEL